MSEITLPVKSLGKITLPEAYTYVYVRSKTKNIVDKQSIAVYNTWDFTHIKIRFYSYPVFIPVYFFPIVVVT